MRKTFFAVALAAMLTFPLVGQGFIRHTIPSGFDTVDGNYTVSISGGSPFNGPNPCRWQWTYDWRSVYHQFPITVFELSFRRASDTMTAGGTYSGVTITMASAVGSHTNSSSTFANNLDADATVVYTGDIIIPPAPGGAMIAPWNVNIPLQIPFEFDATRQQDLVIDVQVAGPTPGVGGDFPLDGTFPSPWVSQRGHVSDPASPTSNWFNNNAGPIIELAYLPGAQSRFNITAITSGGGVGDLSLSFTNIPMGATQGYTLLSTTPAASFGFDYGTGPLFGLLPDPVTWTVVTYPLVPGDPFHWTVPGMGSVLFPNTPLQLGTGSLTQFAGQTWELCGVALDPSFNFIGVTPVAVLNL